MNAEWDVMAFFFIPAVVLFAAALVSGQRWLFLVPIIGWPLYLLVVQMDGGELRSGTLGVLSGAAAVWLGLLFHRSRQEEQA